MLPNFQQELQTLHEQNRFRTLRQVESAQEPRIKINGRDVILFCSNNYLGLANHPSLRKAAHNAIDTYGTSTVASALISGYMTPHAELETCMAKYWGTQAAVAFPNGYMANLGVIPTLINREDIVFSDQLNHRSLIDGCRLSRAQIEVYPHGDVTHLAQQLQKSQHHRRRLIVTDGVFSMDGDIAPLPKLLDLAKQYNAMLMVDDAHGTGILGKTGRGTFEHFDLSPNAIDIHMTSGSKALGASGGFIGGKTDLIALIHNRAPAYIYTTAMPPDACASTTAALQLISADTHLHQSLWQNIKTVRAGLQNLGFDLAKSQTQIIPIVIGDDKKTVAISQELYERGIYLYGIRPPTVPEGQSRLRLSVMATHTSEDIACLLHAMTEIRKTFF